MPKFYRSHLGARFGLALLSIVLFAGTGCGTEPASDSNATVATNSSPDGHAHQEYTGRPALPSNSELGKLPRDGGTKWNRLVFEKSPYLRQHSANPVDWYPWGDEAFARAEAEDKPIFLSIGYSTCHWCHVMEHESFEDEEVAAYLNEHFISIKVDREERPDIDNVYMGAVQAIAGRGGWPLTAFLFPDRRPFFGGTYFPKEDRQGRPGFLSLLFRIDEVWKTEREKLGESADQVVNQVRSQKVSRSGDALSAQTLTAGTAALIGAYDPVYGGFGQAPKFPRSHTLSYLLRSHVRTQNPRSLEVVEGTLDHMARGGLQDHVGGGFHRYSVDEKWLVSHFEKMLYDQGLLARSYLEAYQLTRKEAYAEVARGIFEYVNRDLLDGGGAFYSAEDADSEGEEGKFYVWRPEETVEVLGEEDGAWFNSIYGVTESGNFEHSKSILWLERPLADLAAEQGLDLEKMESRLAGMRSQLLDVRSGRIRPGLDDKVLTAWNGLMISALAYGSAVLAEPEYEVRARRAADFILDEMRDKDGRLFRRYRDGDASIHGFIDDYAFFINGLIDLYEANFEPKYLAAAVTLAKLMDEQFHDPISGAYFFQPSDGEELVLRGKEIYDGALPSGNSVAAWALLRLADLTADPKLTARADEILDSFSAYVAQRPRGYTQMLIALDYAIGPSAQIVLAGNPGDAATRAMVDAVAERFLPNKVVLVRQSGKKGEELVRLAPFLETQTALDGQTTAYVCQNHACSLPTTDVSKMMTLLAEGMEAR